MSDLISREEAIKAVKFYETFCDPYPRVIEALEELPSSQPRKGKWIEVKHTFLHKCSECDWINYHDSGYNFCPNCGADMREGEQDDN